MSNVVIVVDMQRGFLEEGYPLFCGDKARQIIPNVQKLLKEELAKGSTLLFTADTHDPDDEEFQMFQPHCVRGTPEVEITPELLEFVEKGTVIPKNRYSGFFGTDLEQRLAELAPEKLIVCGVCTDICVMHTVADARNRDYTVEVPRDCVASFDPEAHEFALKHMEKTLGAKVV
jgi:nicotinamidase/pyrazinamidase